MRKASRKYPFGKDDLFQQVTGSAILAAPFLFTEEVWRIAANTSALQTSITVGLTLALGHGILYTAKDREWQQERKLIGVTWRYISLMTVSFGTVAMLIFVMATRQTFGADMVQTAKTISIISIFSVIGAATADNLI